MKYLPLRICGVLYFMKFTKEELENETWKDIVEFNCQYQISNLGRVKRKERRVNSAVKEHGGFRTLKEKIIKLNDNGSGYKFAYVKINNIRFREYVHRLVAIYFVENKLNKTDVNHKDFNKSNNRASNLEWCSKFENSRHYSKSIPNKYVGVKRADTVSEKWCARINYKGIEYYIGIFNRKDEARIARNKFIIENNFDCKIR